MEQVAFYRKYLHSSLNKSKGLSIALVFIIITFLIISCYDLLFSGYFIWDDKSFLFDDLITSKPWLSILLGSHYGLYHPLTSVFVKLGYLIFKNNSIYLHAIILLLHIMNSFIVFKIFKLLKFSNIIQVLIFATFLFHPNNIETYAWLTSIKDLTAGFFVLSSVYYYLKFREHILKGYNRYSITLIIMSIAAILSKPTTIYLPFIIYLIESSFQKRYFHRANLHLLLVLIPLGTFVVIHNYYIRISSSSVFMLDGYRFYERILIASVNIIEYTLSALAFRPPSLFYPYSFKPGDSSTYALSLIPLALLVIPYFVLPRKSKLNYILALSVGLVLLLPVLQLVPIGESMRNDRYIYPFIVYILFVVAILITLLTKRIGKQKELLPFLLLFAMLSLNLIRYCDRVKDWNDQKELFTVDFTRHNNSEVLANTLGVLYLNSGNPGKAIEFFKKATQLDGQYANAYTNLGKAYSKLENPKQAIPMFVKSIRLVPFQFEAYHELAASYYTLGEYLKADSVLSVQFDKNDDKSLNLLGKINYQLGDVHKSIELHSDALKIKRSEYYLYDLSISYGKAGDYSKSLELINEAVKLNNRFAEAYYLKGIILIQRGEDPCSNFQKALSLGYEEARNMLRKYCP